MLETISSLFYEIIAFVLFTMIFHFKQKGQLKGFLSWFPSKEFFFKLNARLELLEMNMSTIQRQLMNIQNKNVDVNFKQSIQKMRKTQ